MLIIIPSLILLVIAIAITYAIKSMNKGDKIKEKKVVKEKKLFDKKEPECC